MWGRGVVVMCAWGEHRRMGGWSKTVACVVREHTHSHPIQVEYNLQHSRVSNYNLCMSLPRTCQRPISPPPTVPLPSPSSPSVSSLVARLLSKRTSRR